MAQTKEQNQAPAAANASGEKRPRTYPPPPNTPPPNPPAPRVGAGPPRPATYRQIPFTVNP